MLARNSAALSTVSSSSRAASRSPSKASSSSYVRWIWSGTAGGQAQGARAGSRSVMPMDVAAHDARRFLVARQMLAPARSVDGGPDGVLEVFGRLGSIQFDPLAVAGRSHDLMLHARVADYDPDWCHALYQRREIFE